MPKSVDAAKSTFDAALMGGMSLVRRQVLTDGVYANLSALIVSGEIPPDTRINIESVARQLDVSPTPVREALARLESDELVEKVALKGYRTTALLSPREIAELYDLRMLLEPMTASRAATHIDSTAVARLSAELDAGRSAADSGDGVLLSRHDERLHNLIFEMAGNETVQRTYERAHVHLHLFRLSYGKGTISTVEEHEAIVAGLIESDPSLAEAGMVRHLRASRERFT